MHWCVGYSSMAVLIPFSYRYCMAIQFMAILFHSHTVTYTPPRSHTQDVRTIKTDRRILTTLRVNYNPSTSSLSSSWCQVRSQFDYLCVEQVFRSLNLKGSIKAVGAKATPTKPTKRTRRKKASKKEDGGDERGDAEAMDGGL